MDGFVCAYINFLLEYQLKHLHYFEEFSNYVTLLDKQNSC